MRKEAADKKHAGRTDWTAYYKKKKSRFSAYTQQFTLEKIIGAIDRYSGKEAGKGLKILELGGGRSCFAEQICRMRNVAVYDIADSNSLAVRLFNQMKMNSRSHSGIKLDLLKQEADRQMLHKYDFVFSVGLIEHFQGKDVETVISRHFDCCRPQGTVMITFPTPTKKYRIVRKCMEILGVWQFHDETPIRYEEAEDIFEMQGTVMNCFINRKLPLTQMVVIVKNNGKGEQDVSQD